MFDPKNGATSLTSTFLGGDQGRVHSKAPARGSRHAATELGCVELTQSLHIATMEPVLKIALVGAGMFGGDVHAHAYADLQRAGISPQLGRVGLDAWAREMAAIKFELVAVATRSEKSARRAQKNYKDWTGAKPSTYSGDKPWLDILRDFPDLDVMAVATPD